jgi:hypothetical protein
VFLVGVVTIFAGFLVHMSKLSLGISSPVQRRAGECPWKLGAIALVVVPVIILGFWLPRPLYELVRQTANIIGGVP